MSRQIVKGCRSKGRFCVDFDEDFICVLLEANFGMASKDFILDLVEILVQILA